MAFLTIQVAALSLAMVRDGGPTQHPERALLSAMLLAAACAGAQLATLLRHRRVHELLGLGLVVTLVACFARSRRPMERFVDRQDEVAIGKASANVVPSGETILVEVEDYGWLAATAALGRPEDIVPDRSIDPRSPRRASSFQEGTAILQEGSMRATSVGSSHERAMRCARP